MYIYTHTTLTEVSSLQAAYVHFYIYTYMHDVHIHISDIRGSVPACAFAVVRAHVHAGERERETERETRLLAEESTCKPSTCVRMYAYIYTHTTHRSEHPASRPRFYTQQDGTPRLHRPAQKRQTVSRCCGYVYMHADTYTCVRIVCMYVYIYIHSPRVGRSIPHSVRGGDTFPKVPG
jgi:hypothetical protein